MRRLKRIATIAVTAGIVLAGMATPAAADTWVGTPPRCSGLPNGGSPYNWGGWCNGTGPNYTYHSRITCSGSGTYTQNGPMKWAGDSGGSFAACLTGDTFSNRRLLRYEFGVHVGTVYL
ncbi:hypothetical protein Prum_068090 [Phytohabitans rumicis]|uniref:Uncharacterized protein n=1 Tax=Phytohabitans rumicis TaxID=1076125 RepID=A0A6V8LGG1_9ACTN|nr:hypothetical protein Prum_068090 [Phytohabitans rumicis]